MEILERYHKQFSALHEELINQPKPQQVDMQSWLRNLIESLITIHEGSKGLYKEMNVLYYTNPEVASIIDQQRENSSQSAGRFFQLWQDDIQAEDLEATAIVAFDFISAIVDQIVFGKNTIERERIITTAVDALMKFLIK